jgi:hypothetical protein
MSIYFSGDEICRILENLEDSSISILNTLANDIPGDSEEAMEKAMAMAAAEARLDAYGDFRLSLFGDVKKGTQAIQAVKGRVDILGKGD